MREYKQCVNYHVPQCNVFEDFRNHLKDHLPKDEFGEKYPHLSHYKKRIDFDKKIDPSKRFNFLCCCKTEIPHNEALKFTIDGKEEELGLSDGSIIADNITWKEFK